MNKANYDRIRDDYVSWDWKYLPMSYKLKMTNRFGFVEDSFTKEEIQWLAKNDLFDNLNRINNLS